MVSSFFISSLEMLKLVFSVAFLFSFGLTNAGQEQVKVQVLNLLTDPSQMVLRTHSQTDLPVAVSVGYEHLHEISSSVLMAEAWVRTHVLSYFPSTKITTIVVGNNVVCNNEHGDKWGFVLPSVKNIYHSLKRWGFEEEIKVSPVFSAECLHPFTSNFREDLGQTVIKPLLGFLQSLNLTYSINAPPNFSPLVSAYEEAVKKFGVFDLREINVVMFGSYEEKKPKMRKLFVYPFPARPTPLPEPANSIGFSVPSHVAKNPLPPLPQTSPPPPLAQSSPPPTMSFPFAPQRPPFVLPSNPPDAYMFPPCNLGGPSVSPTPGTGEEKGVWCVAKPSVPEEKLQEAMDYACGVGGADCDEIKPMGVCYYPDTMASHASYAFNSYWQKNKNKGGTCNFGGAAMLIAADPSFQHCKFTLIN